MTRYNLARGATRARPMYDRMSEHDSPHGADMDRGYRSKTDTLIWRCSGATRSWVWPFYPPLGESVQSAPAPSAVISAKATWTTFGFAGAETFVLPWRFTEGFEKIQIYTGIMSPMNAPFSVRWDSQTLVDAVVTATGEPSNANIRPGSEPEMLSWDLRKDVSDLWGYGSWSSCVTPNVPANRRIKLAPYVKCENDWAGFYTGASFNIYMVTAAVMDLPPAASVGW